MAAASSMPLHAQDRSDSDASASSPALETVTVTGSRIVVPNETSISPVTAVSAEEITNTGRTRVEDVLNTLPQVFGSQNSGVSNGSNGTATVNLRNLDSKRTLVLIDGRRLGPGDPTGGFLRNTYGADLNMIPSQLIERVDVLTGGASSTYGADAVAGVVNFAMKKHFEGVEINTSYGFNQHSNHNDAVDSILANNAPVITTPSSVNGGYAKDINLIMGINSPDGRGNATAYATFRTISAITQARYDYSACTLNSGDNLTCGGSSTTGPPNSYGRFQQILPDGTKGPNQSLNADGTLSPYTANNNYNYGATNYFQRPDERWTAGAFAHYEFNDHADAYSEFMFMRDNTTSQIAPSGAFSQGYPFSNSGGLTVNCSNPLLSAAELAQWCGGSTASPDATLIIGRRDVEGGPRQQSLTHTDWRIVVGSRGEIVDGWKYDAYAQQGEVQFNSTFSNDVSWNAIQNSLLVESVNGVPTCRSVINGTDPNCVPWNIFGTGPITKAATNYLSIPLLNTGTVTERVVDGNVTGDLGKYGVQTPWAKSGLAVNFGFEYRQEKSNFLPDFAYQQGLGAGQGGATPPVAGQYSVREGFMEARMPLLNDVPFAKSLSLETGYRYSSYSLDFKTNTYKFGVEYSPLDDIRFRGSFQRAVRVPNIGELYSPDSVGLDGVTDLCSGPTPTLSLAQCARTGVTAATYGTVDQNSAAQYNGLTGGNPQLKPETAITKSFGVSLTPSFIEGLRITVDYFDIKIENAIQNPNADFTLILCSQTGDPNLCNKIHRDPFGALDGSPSNSYVEDTLVNIGSLKTRGVDIDSSYKLSLNQWGKLGFKLTGTYTNKYITSPQPGAEYDCAGYYGGICQAPTPKWRSNFTTSYTTPIQGLDFAATWRFMDAVRLDSNAPGLEFLKGTNYEHASDQRLSSRSYLDLTASYQYDKYNVRVGVNNVLDKDPPINGAGVCPTGPCNGNTWPVMYDVVGRQLFLMLTAEF